MCRIHPPACSPRDRDDHIINALIIIYPRHRPSVTAAFMFCSVSTCTVVCINQLVVNNTRTSLAIARATAVT